MNKSLIWRIILTAGILLVATIFVLPTFLLPPPTPGMKESPKSGLAAILPSARVNLGLDLMGGIHLTLEVEAQKALDTSLAQMGQDLMGDASSKGILMTKPIMPPEGGLEFNLASTDKDAQLKSTLSELYSQLEILSATPGSDGRVRYRLGLTSAARDRILGLTIDQALTTIRNRIDQFGVAEPDVRKEQSGNRITIQLPGMSDPQRAVEIIGKTAHLEFRIVRSDVNPASRTVPRGVQILPLETKDAYGNIVSEPIAVDDATVLTGDRINNAAPAFDNSGSAMVSLSFDRRGADIFSRITEQNVGKRLAIVLDGKVHSAPRINEKIPGGKATITGNFTPAAANDLAVVLRAGALPAPVLVLEQRTVGPSLGQESIHMGITAALVGGIAIIVFMTLYYSLSGIIASLMLFLDILLILSGMAIFGATLTMPGIAGIVLTLGMAVDANVLIFERIREELGRGLTPAAAIEAGFSRAMLAITDSNLTTILAAVILYQFGTGPVRGFAVTLTIGILASMFTAIFVSHIIFDIWIGKSGRRPSI
ncbi:MAG: protein translocase subunit SecD [Desulfovibrio sp.]|jgi:preprotein translocase subunit SecD|nr:protein translocase subunit SecD [Desulfovibrio sp.]